jgi:hypothetical protein
VTRAAQELIEGFAPETELERALSEDPRIVEGLTWGKPRRGHPEGSVASHVADLLETIDRWGEQGQRRSDMRAIAIVHDSQKHRVESWRPKMGENHHAMRARRVAERHTDDERLLAAIQWHDRPYALWRRLNRTGVLQEDEFERMVEAVPDLDLFLRFVEIDGSTEGKNPEPVRWFRDELVRRGLVSGSDG